MSAPQPPTPPPSRPQHPPSLWRTAKAVAWSVFGVRKGSDYHEDIQQLRPLHIIAVGLVAIFVLVLGLIVLVHWVV